LTDVTLRARGADAVPAPPDDSKGPDTFDHPREGRELDLDRVACPCLCLWGADDNWVPLQDGMEYARRLRAPLRSIAGCGHLLIGERPDAVLRAVREFLDRIEMG